MKRSDRGTLMRRPLIEHGPIIANNGSRREQENVFPVTCTTQWMGGDGIIKAGADQEYERGKRRRIEIEEPECVRGSAVGRESGLMGRFWSGTEILGASNRCAPSVLQCYR